MPTSNERKMLSSNEALKELTLKAGILYYKPWRPIVFFQFEITVK